MRYRCDTTSDTETTIRGGWGGGGGGGGGGGACDDEMLQELDVSEPKGIREKIDRILLRLIIGRKRKWGLGIEWSNELADEIHKSIRRKFVKRRVFASDVDAIWSADLVEMESFSKQNRGYKYIPMIFEVFSKYGWPIPLKTNTGLEVTKAFQHLCRTQSPPRKLWTDKGKEFYNKSMKDIVHKYNVDLYSTENVEKSSIVERWNRTIKRNMWNYFSANNTMKYIDILPNLKKKYNNTYHRSIKCTPAFSRATSNY